MSQDSYRNHLKEQCLVHLAKILIPRANVVSAPFVSLFFGRRVRVFGVILAKLNHLGEAFSTNCRQGDGYLTLCLVWKKVRHSYVWTGT